MGLLFGSPALIGVSVALILQVFARRTPIWRLSQSVPHFIVSAAILVIGVLWLSGIDTGGAIFWALMVAILLSIESWQHLYPSLAKRPTHIFIPQVS